MTSHIFVYDLGIILAAARLANLAGELVISRSPWERRSLALDIAGVRVEQGGSCSCL